MKSIIKMTLQILTLIAGICIYSSCSGDDYVNAIPSNTNALICLNPQQAGKTMPQNGEKLMESIFKTKDVSNCGIDFSENIYFFESADGNIGCCAKVSSNSDAEKWLDELQKQGHCTKPIERRGLTFTLLGGSWALGLSDKAALIIGPVLPAQQPDAIRTLTRLLKQDEDEGIKSSPIYSKLDSIEGALTMVAQVSALPEKISAPFTIGCPKGADLSQICIAASMETGNNGCISINGESFSFNQDIDKALKTNIGKLHKISGRYTSNIPESTLCSIFTNANGNDFVEMMHNSPSLGVMLAGLNTAIDMDNILRCVNGDILIGVESYSEKNIKMTMAAQLANTDFLKDVEYWKKSCSSGSSIENCGKNAFCYKSSETQFWFGVAGNKEFYGSTNQAVAANILNRTPRPLPQKVTAKIKQQRFCMVMNIRQLINANSDTAAIGDILQPLLGNVRYIIYGIK